MEYTKHKKYRPLAITVDLIVIFGITTILFNVLFSMTEDVERQYFFFVFLGIAAFFVFFRIVMRPILSKVS